MKTLPILPSIFMLLFTLFSCSNAGAQDSKKEKEKAVKNWVENKDYIFMAQSAMPMSGRVRQLTPEYTLTVSGDTINSFLPYFGRSYSAPINPSEGGIKFTSTNSEYSITPKKKGGWDIIIKPKDVQDVQQLRMTIFLNGTASLQVSSNNRQFISFNGYITQNEAKKKE